MTTDTRIDRRSSKRSVLGSIFASLLLAGTVVMGLELAAMLIASPHSAAQALARTSDGFVAFERHIERSGTLIGYHPQF
jgi:hypothetical protein